MTSCHVVGVRHGWALRSVDSVIVGGEPLADDQYVEQNSQLLTQVRYLLKPISISPALYGSVVKSDGIRGL